MIFKNIIFIVKLPASPKFKTQGGIVDEE